MPDKIAGTMTTAPASEASRGGANLLSDWNIKLIRGLTQPVNFSCGDVPANLRRSIASRTMLYPLHSPHVLARGIQASRLRHLLAARSGSRHFDRGGSPIHGRLRWRSSM